MTKGKQDEIKHEGEKGEAGGREGGGRDGERERGRDGERERRREGGGREGGGREGETLIVAASEGWQQTVS